MESGLGLSVEKVNNAARNLVECPDNDELAVVSSLCEELVLIELLELAPDVGDDGLAVVGLNPVNRA